ncbi:expressed unknown protein [Seminavis robusta]|uniref:Uncharacterized protein n=1 Tax=Seminavis robusta TaxID=568900 RepID=A0A9N8EA29_9STRA|nr:expressed unknown protein [Seminavis robusta]|eukprot:Sro793_g203230.1 n/a (143) ;mRNA; r:19254-19682
MGFRFKPMDATAIYGPLLEKQEGVEYDNKKEKASFPEAQYVFNAKPEHRALHAPDVKVYCDDKVDFFPVISHYMARMLLGAVLGKNNPGDFALPSKDVAFDGIGRESNQEISSCSRKPNNMYHPHFMGYMVSHIQKAGMALR